MKPVVLSGLATALLISSSVNLFAQEKKESIPEAVAVEAGSLKSILPKNIDGKTRPLTVNVELTSQAAIAGTMTEVDQIQIKTSFGEAQIPMSEIAGIRFASAQDSTTTVVMLNGDSITGATDIKQLSVETEWGSAKINGTAIQSILFVPDLKWVNSNSLNGRRWFLVDAKQAAAASASGNPNSPNTTGNTGASTGQPTNPPRPNTTPNVVPR